MTISNPFDEIAGLKAQNQELRRLLRAENVSARAIADARDAQRTAEEERDKAVTNQRASENELSTQVVNLELAMEDVVKWVEGHTLLPSKEEVWRIAKDALRKQAER